MMRNINIVDIFSLVRINIFWNVWCEIPILDPRLFACPKNIIWFLKSMYYKFLEIRHWVGRCFFIQKMSVAFMTHVLYFPKPSNFFLQFLTKDWSNTKEICQVSILTKKICIWIVFIWICKAKVYYIAIILPQICVFFCIVS